MKKCREVSKVKFLVGCHNELKKSAENKKVASHKLLGDNVLILIPKYKNSTVTVGKLEAKN